jgi:hypothetical protein
MTRLAVADLDDGLAWLAEQIEAALAQAGRRGVSPATAARRVRCTTADARLALAWLTGQQRAHPDTRNRHPDRYLTGRAR